MFGKRLKALRSAAGLSQKKLAEIIDVSQQTVGSWEVDRSSPSPEMISRIASALSIDANTRLNHSPSNRQGVRIPVLGRVQAGVPIDAIEEILDWEEIDQATASKGEYFGLVVRGDSMETDIHDGDIVIVRKQSYAETGDIVIALVNGDDATVKKIKYQKNGIMLIPLNSAYEPLFYSAEEIESLPVSILGIVIESRRKFK